MKGSVHLKYGDLADFLLTSHNKYKQYSSLVHLTGKTVPGSGEFCVLQGLNLKEVNVKVENKDFLLIRDVNHRWSRNSILLWLSCQWLDITMHNPKFSMSLLKYVCLTRTALKLCFRGVSFFDNVSIAKRHNDIF